MRYSMLLIATLAATPAIAQNPQPADPGTQRPPLASPSSPSPPPERIAPSTGTLSGDLSRQRGTISPPNVDPGMNVKPPPDAGASTPVIPPPGSPGGNQSVIPK